MAFHSRRGTANMLRRDDVMEMPQFDDTFQTNSRPYSDVGHRLNFDVDPTLLCTVGCALRIAYCCVFLELGPFEGREDS